VDESVAAILRLRPHLVVIEVALHNETGLQVMKRVQTVCAGIQFIVCTNDVERQNREQYLKGGARAFLNKTIETEQLPSAIAAACGR
jgi:DNA-binding NarL/FixJ family response regulator